MGAVAQQFGVTDDARLVYGNAGDYLEAGSVAVATGGKFLSPNSLDLERATITDSRNLGLSVGSGATTGDISLVTSDPELLNRSFATLGEYLNQSQEKLTEANEANKSFFGDLVAKLGKVIEGKTETAMESVATEAKPWMQYGMWAVGIAVGVWLVSKLFGRKK